MFGIDKNIIYLLVVKPVIVLTSLFIYYNLYYFKTRGILRSEG